MTLPLVAIIVPCFNKSASVERTIRSVQAQTLSNFECVVVDDCSTDDSIKVIKHAIAKDSRFKFLQTPNNSGVARVRNLGATETSAPFVCFLDGDDAIEPTFLEVCVKALQDDRTLGLAYTKLLTVTPDGHSSISSWPAEWDFDSQLMSRNQVPTCNVMRRVAFKRLGGYNSRACGSLGAGFEDASLWLRMGEFGWKCKLATTEPLFVYSWGSGLVSGQSEKEIQDALEDEINFYRVWDPWYTDHLHPFASYATPENHSHPVQQYDEPLVSVIIPVGPGHEQTVLNAIQSVEAQSMRLWELIVVWDSPEPIPPLYKSGYPFIKWLETGGAKGAGYARNRGAELATGLLILFTDADDWLYPQFLHKTLDAWNKEQEAVYTDFVGKAFITDEGELEKLKRYGRLLQRDGDEVVTRHSGLPFDCQKAMREPDPSHDFYVWCNITVLHPKSWWAELGGFDEDMPSWEDWDYWLRMVHKGHCFTQIKEPLMVYRFYTGGRRELAHTQDKDGRFMYDKLIRYMRAKYEREGAVVGCNGCGKRGSVTGVSYYEEAPIDPNLKVLVEYQSANRGDRWIDSPSQLAVTGNRSGYGYHAPGDRFEAFMADAKMMPMQFIIIGQAQQTPVAVVAAAPATPLSAPLTVSSMMDGKQDVQANLDKLGAAMERSRQDMIRQYLGKEATPEYVPSPIKAKRKPGRPRKIEKVETETETEHELV